MPIEIKKQNAERWHLRYRHPATCAETKINPRWASVEKDTQLDADFNQEESNVKFEIDELPPAAPAQSIPPVKGGQGRTDDEVYEEGNRAIKRITFALLAIIVIGALFLLFGCGGGSADRRGSTPPGGNVPDPSDNVPSGDFVEKNAGTYTATLLFGQLGFNEPATSQVSLWANPDEITVHLVGNNLEVHDPICSLNVIATDSSGNIEASGDYRTGDGIKLYRFTVTQNGATKEIRLRITRAGGGEDLSWTLSDFVRNG